MINVLPSHRQQGETSADKRGTPTARRSLLKARRP
jgi:hypothetical protein